LVASRYLKEYGYEVDVLYPKKTENNLYLRLIQQCEKYDIKFVDNNVIEKLNEYDLIIDSIFGFSFKGELRAPFDNIIQVKIY
jgi:NAD(P)H-hydrate epimerase